jgi:glycosyltransferase involved in cell wall biosynthesis
MINHLYSPSPSSERDRAVRRIAIVGNHTPRRCGIATFTHNLADAIRLVGIEVDVIAMSDQSGYEYPDGVVFEIPQDDVSAYHKAAERMNAGGYDLVHVQHEFGIFGGLAGAHILALVRDLKMPVVTTLHTVLSEPSLAQRSVLDELVGLSQTVLVMSRKAGELLCDSLGVSEEKICLIPHGVPDLPEESADSIKESFGLAGKQVVLTFGLLSPDKGIEVAVEAMADVPDAIYVVAGQTHPNIVRQFGETYRASLQARAEDLGISDRVRFIDKFADEAELCRLLKMADVYVTPYLKTEQITSGTLAYAVGNGKAVVSTPYWHAKELLSEGRGMLVPARDAQATAEAIRSLLENPIRKEEIERKAHQYGSAMRWSAVAAAHLDQYRQASSDSNRLLRELEVTSEPNESVPGGEIPLRHLQILSDGVGIIQHATYHIPNRSEGYCIDDNARALLVTVLIQQAGMGDDQLELMQSRYLSFCAHALNRETGRFRNFMSYERQWLEESGSEDSHGRTLWCLGVAAKHAASRGVRSLARDLFETASPATDRFISPRAWAYSGLGFWNMSGYHGMARMVARLVGAYEAHSSPEWPWFEPIVAYANARLPQILIKAGQSLGNERAVSIGLESLEWLCQIQEENGVFCPIGSEGFYPQGGAKAKFDQQPIEAAGHVSACLAAFEATGDRLWKRRADWAFNWFLGANLLGIAVAVPGIGACCDGLRPNGVNENQGAESTLSYLGALAELASAPRPAQRGILL